MPSLSWICGSPANVSAGTLVAPTPGHSWGGAAARQHRPTMVSANAGPSGQHNGRARRLSRSSPRRVLLLGTGSAGKTTLFRQIAAQHWSSRDLTAMVDVIHGTIVVAIKELVQCSKRLSITDPIARTALNPSTPAGRSATFVMTKLEYDSFITSEAAKHIQRVWIDPAIQRTFELRAKHRLRIADSARYFLDRIEHISMNGYVPSASDILHCSVRSTGIAEAQVEIHGKPVQLLDIGGQRSQRKKWIKCFHNVAAIVYVVALSEFDEVLEEDGKTNRIIESLVVFEELVNSASCADIPIVLVLNKIDLLDEKMKAKRVSDYFPRFSGGQDLSRAISFFKQMFMGQVDRHGQHRVTVVSCVSTTRSTMIPSIKIIRDVITNSQAGSLSRTTSYSSAYSSKKNK